jgi:2-aminoadipate transaminase
MDMRCHVDRLNASDMTAIQERTPKVGIRWQEKVAERTASIHGSFNLPMDELLVHPDPILFTGGTPSPEFLPIKHLQACNQRAWEVTNETMYYGDTEGYLPLRERIAERMSARHVDVSPDEILVTNGAQQGLDLISRILLDPGDTVMVEAPTYFGALQVFDMYQARYEAVEMDQGGMIPESLEAALERAERPKFIYSIPTYQNPTGVTVAPERRKQLIEIAHRFNVPIVEDDPYGELWFGKSGSSPLRADSEDIIYLGTFSKTIVPAIRMGWMCAPTELMPKLIDAKEGVDISSDRIVQRMVVEATANGWLDQHLDWARADYAARRDQLDAALREHMPDGTTWTCPGGGFFVWGTLPGNTDSYEMLYKVAKAGAFYLPGTIFYVDGRTSPSFRLGFTTLPMERYEEGVERMGAALKQHL